MERPDAARFSFAHDRNAIVLDAALDAARQIPAQLAFWTFNGNGAIGSDVHFHLVRNLDDFVSDT
jgi:hypothetical protein